MCDVGYNIRVGFLAPYCRVWYHLSDFSERIPSSYKKPYDYWHLFFRTSVERAFGFLKGRSKILASSPYFPFRTQVDLVLACILHNFIITNGSDEFIRTEDGWIVQDLSQVGRLHGGLGRSQMLGFNWGKKLRSLCGPIGKIHRVLWCLFGLYYATVSMFWACLVFRGLLTMLLRIALL